MSEMYFAYYRKSTDTEDKQVLSLDGQEETVTEFAEHKGLKISKEFKESFSAKEAGRPVFSQMVEELSEGKAAGVIAYKADRLTRNYTDLGILVSLLESGTEIWDTSYGEYKNDSNGKMMIGINTVMAKRKIDDLSEDTKRGLKQKAAMGWFPGWAPTGYTNDKLKKTIAPDPKSAPHIKRAFDLYATGRCSIKDITEILDSEGFRPRTGNKLTTSSLATFLRNPFYYGVFKWRGEVLPGKHEPLISRETFDQVQEILDGRAPIQPRSQKLVFTYRGLLHCGECGCSITAERHKKVQKNGNVHHYTYYRCSKSKDRCSQTYIREEGLERQFMEMFEGIEFTPDLADFVMEKIKATISTTRSELKDS